MGYDFDGADFNDTSKHDLLHCTVRWKVCYRGRKAANFSLVPASRACKNERMVLYSSSLKVKLATPTQPKEVHCTHDPIPSRLSLALLAQYTTSLRPITLTAWPS